ncbi:14335_t:CDS:2 [Cetraspora pellucida]|uniref:14335_t:CDS:1 n=1 Tax=Cetraspora pellucida TaxID=1433469 RepID=A0A9N9CNQ1_9GLOM|nr:14335_t:CDS:2 [Cetraspora pellucida]
MSANNETGINQLSTSTITTAIHQPSEQSQPHPSVKPCCACPDTKKARDECIFQTGDEEKCRNLIEAHKTCMRSYGKVEILNKYSDVN